MNYGELNTIIMIKVICIITIIGTPYTNFLRLVLCLIICMVMHIKKEPPMAAINNKNISGIRQKPTFEANLSYTVMMMPIPLTTMIYGNISNINCIFNINPLKK